MSYNVPNQYFFGTELIIGSIVEKDGWIQSAKVDVVYSKVRYRYDFSEEKYTGEL